MSTIRFFHVADVHFGVENYGKVDPQTGIHTRLLDFQKSLATCVDAAVAANVDFFLLAGDAYKTAYPTPTQQRLLMTELFKLYAANIPVVIVVGNHDHPLSFGKANALDVFGQLPLDGFVVFSRPELIRLQTKSGPVQIVGIPWPTRNTVIAKEEHRLKTTGQITQYIAKQVSGIITQLALQVDPNSPAVLTGHLTVSNGIFSGSEKCAVYGSDPIFLPSQLALPMFDYVALGHLHRYQDLNKNGYPGVVYSGSIDRVDFGERKETKGYCDVTISLNEQPGTVEGQQYSTLGRHTFVELATRPFVQIEVQVLADDPPTGQLLAAIKKHDIVDAIVKLIYHLPTGTADTVDLAAVSRALKGAMYVVGVIPVHTPVKRERRLQCGQEMPLQTLVESYLDSHDELRHAKKRLLNKALALQAELEATETS